MDYKDDIVISEWLRNKTPENVSSWIESEDNFSVVCVGQDRGIVGIGIISLEGEILLNYLLPEALFKGNGKLMLNAMEEKMYSIDVNTVNAVSTITAKSFYEKNGYIKSGKPFLVGGKIEGIPLSKSLL